MELERTADGSYTLYVPELDEHYHSVKGAMTESQHIFIEMGLKHSPASEPRILEIGLGTGLNAFLTLIAAGETQRKVHYTGIERYPLTKETLKQLDYPHMIGKQHEEDYYAIHQAPWGEDAVITPWFTLHKVEGDFTEINSQGEGVSKHALCFGQTHGSAPTVAVGANPWVRPAAKRNFDTPSSQEGKMDTPAFDIIYFDAFAPEKQPEMWEQSLFNTLYNILNDGGILTTYCAKGVVRRMLQTAGFTVERLPGPPGGKREILRATKDATVKLSFINNSSFTDE